MTQMPLLDDITPALEALGDLAGRRRWVLELAPGLTLLNANHRMHWRPKAERTAELRRAGWAVAKQQKIPALARAHVLAVIRPASRQRIDPANFYPSVKPAVDGLVDAGVLSDDDAAHLDGPDMRLGQLVKGGQLVLVITDLGGAA
jgi:crossover junction endodeoxyribonuclease RusA